MFTMEVPYVPAPETPIVLVQAGTAAAAPPQPDFILNACQPTQSTGSSISAVRGVDPGYALANALSEIAGRDVAPDLSAIKNITLLEGTKHGKIFAEVDNEGLTSYHYDPTPNYVGNDRAVFMAEFGGKHYKIVVNLKVSITVDYKTPECPANPYELIKVNGKPVSGSSGYDSGYGNGFSLGTISVTFADLLGGAVGQAVGITITLDTPGAIRRNAAAQPARADCCTHLQ